MDLSLYLTYDMIFYKIICTHLFFFSLRASNNRKEKETLNRSSEERVEDDRGDELMMENWRWTQHSKLVGDLNCSRSNHGWMRTSMMEDRTRNWPANSLDTSGIRSVYCIQGNAGLIGVPHCLQPREGGQTETRSVLWSQLPTRRNGGVVMTGEEQRGAAGAGRRRRGAAAAARP